MCKVQMAKVYHDIIQRAIQLHGSLGVSLELPLGGLPRREGLTSTARIRFDSFPWTQIQRATRSLTDDLLLAKGYDLRIRIV